MYKKFGLVFWETEWQNVSDFTDEMLMVSGALVAS